MMKSKLKKIFVNALYNLGIYRLISKFRKNKITVLTVHGVMEKHKGSQWTPIRSQLPTRNFRSTLSTLSKYYQFVTLDQAVDMIEGLIPTVNNAMLLTFDDGYRNNLNYALPICEEFGVKPVLFVSTYHIDTGKPFWFDRMDYALQHYQGKEIKQEHGGIEYHFDCSTKESLADSYNKFRAFAKNNFDNDIEMNELFDKISSKAEYESGKSLEFLSQEDDWSAVATWDQLKNAVEKGLIDVASHTVRHLRLNRLVKSEIRKELIESKLRIEEKLGVPCSYFCFPNGDFNDFAVDQVKEANYRAAFSTVPGECEEGDDLFVLRRINFPADKTGPETLHYLLTHRILSD